MSNPIEGQVYNVVYRRVESVYLYIRAGSAEDANDFMRWMIEQGYLEDNMETIDDGTFVTTYPQVEPEVDLTDPDGGKLPERVREYRKSRESHE